MDLFEIETKVNEALERLEEDELKRLEGWALMASRDTIAAGGIGQTHPQQSREMDTWDGLSAETKAAHETLVNLTEDAVVDELAGPLADEDWADVPIEVALPYDWPAWPYLSAKDCRGIMEGARGRARAKVKSQAPTTPET